jgi:S1-C subfamily serine protease
MKCGVACFLTATSALAQSTAARTAKDAPALVSKAGASPNLLRAFASSLETVISKVSPAVVEAHELPSQPPPPHSGPYYRPHTKA